MLTNLESNLLLVYIVRMSDNKSKVKTKAVAQPAASAAIDGTKGTCVEQ